MLLTPAMNLVRVGFIEIDEQATKALEDFKMHTKEQIEMILESKIEATELLLFCLQKPESKSKVLFQKMIDSLSADCVSLKQKLEA